MNILGIDIGGTYIKSGLMDYENNMIIQRKIPTQAELPREFVINNIIDLIKQYSEQYEFEAIGIGVPGVVIDGVIIVAPNFNDWVNVNLLEQIRAKFDKPIFIDNDANAAALAELHHGEGIGLNSFIYITLGTGVGGGIIINNDLYKGEYGGAGEIGHFIINAFEENHNELQDYRQGVLEVYAGRKGILEIAEKIYSKYNIDKKNFDVKDISIDAANSIPAALEIMDNIGYKIGCAISSMMNLLDIRTVIIGGGISAAGEIILEPIRRTISRKAIPSVSQKFIVKNAKFIENTGIIGACILAKHNL